MKEIIIRVIVGGIAVSAFSLLGDLLKPKSFAGLFGAAPSVALATLVLTVTKEGKEYASTEAKAMVFGSLAFCIYAFAVGRFLIRRQWPVLRTTTLTMSLWFVCAFGLWYAVLR